MARFPRIVLVAAVVLAAALMLPAAYTGSGGETISAPPTPSPSPSSEPPTPTPAPSPTPEPQPSPTVAPSPTPAASPSATPKPAPQGGGEAESIAFALSATPGSIAVGEETTITARVTNPSEEPAEDVDVVVTLPTELAYVSATPSPSSVQERAGRTAVVFRGVDVPANGSLDLVITAEGIDDADAAVVEGSALWQGDEFPATTSVAVELPPSDLSLSTRGPGMLTEVGEQVRYHITIRNDGDEEVEAVSIVNLVPREVHVVAVGVAPGIDGVQVGQAGNGAEDVVWTLDELAVGETVTVSYTGVVEEPGDLKADNETRLLTGPGEVAQSVESTYLAASEGRGASNPRFEPIVEKKVIRKRVTERSLIRRRSPTQPDIPDSSALPYSGVDPWGMAATGALMIALGVLTLRLSSRRREPRRLVATALLVLLVGAACVSNDSEPGDSGLQGEGDRVKGRQIVRGDNEDDAAQQEPESEPDARPDSNQDDAPNDQPGNESAADDAPADPQADDTDDTEDTEDTDTTPDAEGDDGVVEDDDDGAEDTLVLGPPITRTERRTRLVTITEDDLPVLSAESVFGARPVSFGWDDAAGAVTQPGSSPSLGGQEGVELTVEISPAGRGMRATVILRNLNRRSRLAVAGTLGLTIAGDRSSTTLQGEESEVVLNPGGEATASFSYRLPTGSYTARPFFRAH